MVKRLLLIGICAGLFSSCDGNDGEAILSFLVNNRMTVILKGTYATDRPLTFPEINNNELYEHPDPVYSIDGDNAPPLSELGLYFDIGEIRLSTKGYLSQLNEINSQADAEDFWDVLTPERQVYCSRFYTLDTERDSCLRTGGFINFQEFMNGRGALYPSRDVGPGSYTHAGIFMRGFFTGYSRIDGITQVNQFDNNPVEGFNIMPRLNYDPGTNQAEKQTRVPYFFPLHHTTYPGQQTSMTVGNTFNSLVLEIRFNIKENLMLKSFENSQGQVQTVVGISDWRRPHAGQIDMGGNVLTRARMFYPDIVSTVRVSGGTYTGRHYYAIYFQGECIDPTGNPVCTRDIDVLPLAATPVRNGNDNIMENLMQGSYILQCRFDNREDGYPEQVIGETVFEITGTEEEININCACGHSTSSGC